MTVSLPGQLAATSLGRSSAVRIVDLGLGGARVTPPGLLSAGVSVRLAVDAPDRWDPLIVEARVAWIRGDEAGLAFEHSSGRTVRALVEVISQHGYE